MLGEPKKYPMQMIESHLNGIVLDIVGMDDWTEDRKNIEPFYKKKRFGLF